MRVCVCVCMGLCFVSDSPFDIQNKQAVRQRAEEIILTIKREHGTTNGSVHRAKTLSLIEVTQPLSVVV